MLVQYTGPGACSEEEALYHKLVGEEIFPEFEVYVNVPCIDGDESHYTIHDKMPDGRLIEVEIGGFDIDDLVASCERAQNETALVCFSTVARHPELVNDAFLSEMKAMSDLINLVMKRLNEKREEMSRALWDRLMKVKEEK